MCGDDDDDDDDGDGDDDDCWLPVITAPPAHLSLSSQRMMGHLCLTGATGTAGPMLTHLLITPPGQGGRNNHERESPLDELSLEDLLTACQSDTWLHCRTHPLRVAEGELELIPADTGRNSGHTPDRSRDSVSRTKLGKKLEYREKTHTDMWHLHTERPMSQTRIRFSSGGCTEEERVVFCPEAAQGSGPAPDQISSLYSVMIGGWSHCIKVPQPWESPEYTIRRVMVSSTVPPPFPRAAKSLPADGALSDKSGQLSLHIIRTDTPAPRSGEIRPKERLTALSPGFGGLCASVGLIRPALMSFYQRINNDSRHLENHIYIH
ncbi:unnamed protein product [Pleuronectes platessa]|uniref:Uncharacterized protein n=1 Tax=Pleuronectes platessa TaxID=8262 RepID=A0A9N7ULK9_PLEPL|nr:unnamed protein product [Pleuronectes platessa]